MRVVFLFFLMLNGAYLLWQLGYFREPAPKVATELAQPKGVASLTLLRERGLGRTEIATRPAPPQPAIPTVPEPKAAPQPPAPPVEETVSVEETPVPAVQAPASVTLACFTFGPFDKEETANKAEVAISAAGGEVKRRQVEQHTPKAYWVYLPPLENYSDALTKVKELRKKGISDLFIMGKGDKQNAISLGLFSSKATADERMDEVKAMDMKPIMETQYKTTMLDWLDIEVDSSLTNTIATITAIADDFITANLSQRDCE